MLKLGKDIMVREVSFLILAEVSNIYLHGDLEAESMLSMLTRRLFFVSNSGIDFASVFTRSKLFESNHHESQKT